MEQNTLVTVKAENAKPEIFSEVKPAAALPEMIWNTNYNNKMCCDGFMHIDLAPRKRPTTNKLLDKLLFKISTKDDSHEPIVVELHNINYFPLKYLLDMMALASHGITAMELCDFLFIKNHEWLTFDTEIACYSYKKLKQQP
jgi:hypothetical protein